MYTYMEYLQKCFNKSTDWNDDNIYSNITATSQALLEFPIPSGTKLDISSQATKYLASSFTLSNHRSINGSLAYLYSSSPLGNTCGTKDVSLQDAIAGFRIIEPISGFINNNYNTFSRPSLWYGRMYFPGQALEAMVIKRLSDTSQLLVKCINNPQLDKNGTLVVYLQKNTQKFLRELIYSTNEALIGFRCLYNFGNPKERNFQLIPKFDNSVVSVGTEIWYAALTMSPGLSTSFRYSTRSTVTGKPLTMTVSCNPILGLISSTYNVKTSVASTFCSRYDLNMYSYASNLSLGFELYKKSPKSETFVKTNEPKLEWHPKPGAPLNPIVNPIQNLHDYYQINPSLLPHDEHADNMRAFQNLMDESNFSSVLKASTSLNDKMVKFLWEGRVKDFLVSTGVKFNIHNSFPEVLKVGITFLYAC